MKRIRVDLDDVIEWKNLNAAAWKAASGKRHRTEVNRFLHDLETQLNDLRQSILDETVLLGVSRVFNIRDPKPRVIHAPCFRERVLHHALMSHVAPVLDQSMIDDSFACRCKKGTLAAVLRAQHHSRRFAWHAKMDVRQYFASICHRRLKTSVREKIKGRRVLDLIDRILAASGKSCERGLPIGALTSQHFANFYLNRLDRNLVEHSVCRAYVRYMDDFIVWGNTAAEVKKLTEIAVATMQNELGLELKRPAIIQRSDKGLTFCGFRIFPGTIRLAASRRLRLVSRLKHWQTLFDSGEITEGEMQAIFASIVGILQHVEGNKWLMTRMQRVSVVDSTVDC